MEDELQGKVAGTKEYKAIVKKWAEINAFRAKIQKDQEYREKAAKRIIQLLTQTKTIGYSKLLIRDRQQLDAIGIAAKQLVDALDNAKMLDGRVTRDKWDEFM